MINWYTEELGLKPETVETVVLDFQSKEHKKDSFLKVSTSAQALFERLPDILPLLYGTSSFWELLEALMATAYLDHISDPL